MEPIGVSNAFLSSGHASRPSGRPASRNARSSGDPQQKGRPGVSQMCCRNASQAAASRPSASSSLNSSSTTPSPPASTPKAPTSVWRLRSTPSVALIWPCSRYVHAVSGRVGPQTPPWRAPMHLPLGAAKLHVEECQRSRRAALAPMQRGRHNLWQLARPRSKLGVRHGLLVEGVEAEVFGLNDAALVVRQRAEVVGGEKRGVRLQRGGDWW